MYKEQNMNISGRSKEVDELEELLLGVLGVHSSISNSTTLSIIDFKLSPIFSDFFKKNFQLTFHCEFLITFTVILYTSWHFDFRYINLN